jgi:hypothetical protein
LTDATKTLIPEQKNEKSRKIRKHILFGGKKVELLRIEGSKFP